VSVSGRARRQRAEADLDADFRPRAESRVETLLVLSKVAEAEAIVIGDEVIEDEIGLARQRYAGDPKTTRGARRGTSRAPSPARSRT
jgi:FKBP-type peptidyl-prolyl cis-trans isomerase (trigger factor)